jgi:hypothetical protein
MRAAFAILFVLLAGSAFDRAQADPYPWCAVYGGMGGGGGTNCYMRSYEECLVQISGIGGFCQRNPFYDGRPVVTPGEPRRRVKRRHH